MLFIMPRLSQFCKNELQARYSFTKWAIDLKVHE